MPFGVDIDGKCLGRKPGPAIFTDEPLDPPPFCRRIKSIPGIPAPAGMLSEMFFTELVRTERGKKHMTS
jgi:hypothetical protein